MKLQTLLSFLFSMIFLLGIAAPSLASVMGQEHSHCEDGVTTTDSQQDSTTDCHDCHSKMPSGCCHAPILFSHEVQMSFLSFDSRLPIQWSNTAYQNPLIETPDQPPKFL